METEWGGGGTSGLCERGDARGRERRDADRQGDRIIEMSGGENETK